ncbi:MAG: hypothetical protein DWH79_09790 [Planctomycetota bacterium]|nr:MAG: hypothetical protein DWH79_09790 [Planctomycetota bacterium]
MRSPAGNRRSNQSCGSTCRRALVLGACLAAGLPGLLRAQDAGGRRFEELAGDALRATESFRPVNDSALDAAAANLRTAMGPLDRLLARSKSGENWRKYLEWPALQAQASSGQAADPVVLRRIEELLGATQNGLDMADFVRVRKAVTRFAEVADVARGDGGSKFADRLGKLASSLLAASASGQAEALAPVPPILERLTESGQAQGVVAAVRGAASRPNIHLEISEDLLAPAVNRPVDQVQPVDDVVLGTRIRGTGHTRGNVRLDFVPSNDKAVFDIVLDATNISHTRGTQGPVTVNSRGVTEIDARRRIFLDEHTVTAAPVEASADTNSTVTGIGINAPFGKRLIRRIASRKIAESKPQAEAVAEGKARDRIRRQFGEQTEPAVAQMRQQFRDRVRGPLQERGLYPESFHMHTTDRDLRIVARKSLATQLAAFSAPPSAAGGNVITARVHESAVNNILEEKLGGRIITQDDVARIAKEQDMKMPDSLGSDPDAEQKTWAITFAKYRPVTVTAEDSRVKITVRGDKFVSGERDFPGMDIAATYALGRGPKGPVLVREGSVQINPSGFKSGDRKLTMQETSLRRILQKRFDKVFKDTIEIEPLPLKGELAVVGPLPMSQLDSRRDGWMVAGWRKGSAAGSVPGEVIISERMANAAADTGVAVIESVARGVAAQLEAFAAIGNP